MRETLSKIINAAIASQTSNSNQKKEGKYRHGMIQPMILGVNVPKMEYKGYLEARKTYKSKTLEEMVELMYKTAGKMDMNKNAVKHKEK